MLSREATHTNFKVFGLTWSELEPTIYCTRGEHANHLIHTSQNTWYPSCEVSILYCSPLMPFSHRISLVHLILFNSMLQIISTNLSPLIVLQLPHFISGGTVKIEIYKCWYWHDDRMTFIRYVCLKFRVRVREFNAPYNIISVIAWWRKPRVPRENHRPA